MKKTLSILSFVICMLMIISTIYAITDGRAETFVTFFKLLYTPNIIIQNPHGAGLIAANVFVQIFMMWIFYFIGRKLWKSSNEAAINKNSQTPSSNNSEDRIEPKFMD